MQALALLLFMGAGAAVCVLAARVVVRRYRLPWREALMYFGIVPYPGDAEAPDGR